MGSTNADGFNANTGDDLSLAGDRLLGTNDDFLAPRNVDLDAYNDPSNTIRPFDPVYFGFDQYNINASERDKLAEIASFYNLTRSKASYRRLLRLERNTCIQQIIG